MGGTRVVSCVGTARAGATLLLTDEEGLTGTTEGAGAETTVAGEEEAPPPPLW